MEMTTMTQTTPADSELKSVNEPLPEGAISVNDFLAGISQLSILGVIETTTLVEAIHREIVLRPIGLLNHKYGLIWNQGISSRVYSIVKGITLLVGHSLAFAIDQSSHLLHPISAQPLPNYLSQLVNVLNGVMGDHLENKKNPLALPMMLYNKEGLAIAKSTQVSQSQVLSGKVVIILHGLCMGHLNWLPTNEQGLGQRIVKAQPETSVLYLNYNSGRRISTNGRDFSALLQQLITEQPQISEITLIGHSMGGLVSRSALYYGEQAQQQWIKKTKKLITLGTPHHGALLERIGNMVQQTISKLPFAGSLGKLGDIRSSGIIDLRYGCIRDEDWQTLETRSVLPDHERSITPLPKHVAAYFLAASLSESDQASTVAQLLGDGLVNVNSALGEHTPSHTLFIPDQRKAVFYGLGHLGLLSDEQVLAQVVNWLKE